jgi:subtilisin family serine protease
MNARIMIAVAMACFAMPAAAETSAGPFGRAGVDYVDGEVLVRVDDVEDAIVVEVPAGTVPGSVAEIGDIPGVRYAEPNYIVRMARVPNDPLWFFQWGLQKVKAPAAWDSGTGSASVVAVVADTGIDSTHPDLAPNIWRNPGNLNTTPRCGANTFGYDVVGNDCDASDVGGHGTLVAGILGARGNNTLQVAGTSWTVKLMSLRMANSALIGNNQSIANGLNWVLKAKQSGVNIKVVNASWETFGYSPIVRAAIQALGDNGIVFVTAAGNRQTRIFRDTNGQTETNEYYPCSYGLPNMICVAASNPDDLLSSGYSGSALSNWGPAVDLVAPGENILTTTAGGSYQTFSGTSTATPHVAGAVALLASRVGCQTVTRLKSVILSTVDLVFIDVATNGRLDLDEAMIRCGLS